MNILLTGANGLIGQKITGLLSDKKNTKVIVTSRGDLRFSLPANSVYESFDISDRDRAKALFHRYKPAMVINSAAITQADECEKDEERCRKINTEAVQNLIKLSRQFNSFFIQFSTDFVFNGNNGPYREEDTPDPVSGYGLSKWEAEKIITGSDIGYAIIRTILVYGFIKSASRKNIVTWVIESLKAGREIKVVSDQIRTPTLAEDVALGSYLIIKGRHKGIFHIGGKDMLSPYDMAILTAKAFDLDSSLIKKVTTADFQQPARRPLKTGLITDKAERLLGYHPLGFEEGLGIVRQQMEGY